MKTVIVIYTNKKLTNPVEVGAAKKYSFNTEAGLIEGDMIKSPTYTTPMQVVKVLDKAHTYYNAQTGEMSDTYTSTNQWLIRTLVIGTTDKDTVYASLLPE